LPTATLSAEECVQLLMARLLPGLGAG